MKIICLFLIYKLFSRFSQNIYLFANSQVGRQVPRACVCSSKLATITKIYRRNEMWQKLTVKAKEKCTQTNQGELQNKTSRTESITDTYSDD